MKHNMYKIMDDDTKGVHISPNGAFDPFATLCGICDAGIWVAPSIDKEVDCYSCKETFDKIKKGVCLRGFYV